MKPKLLLLPLLLMTASLFADTIADKVAAVQKDLDTAIVRRGALQDAQKALNQKEDDIDFSVAAFKKQKLSYEAQNREFEPRAKAVVAERDRHDAQPPDPKCESCVNAYNAEARQIDGRLAAVRGEMASLQKTSDLLDELRRTITEQTQSWAVRKKQNNADINDNEANIERLQKLLATVRAQYDACKKAGGTLEHQHEVCGKLFDGNAIH